nr:hypothetical protein Iba_chr03eCG1160 [Ipomoea batatas]
MVEGEEEEFEVSEPNKVEDGRGGEVEDGEAEREGDKEEDDGEKGEKTSGAARDVFGRKFYSSGRTPLIDEAVPDLDPVNLSTPPFSGIKVTLDFGSHCYSLLLDDVGNSVSGADEATDRPHFKRRGVKRSLFIEDA